MDILTALWQKFLLIQLFLNDWTDWGQGTRLISEHQRERQVVCEIIEMLPDMSGVFDLLPCFK